MAVEAALSFGRPSPDPCGREKNSAQCLKISQFLVFFREVWWLTKLCYSKQIEEVSA